MIVFAETAPQFVEWSVEIDHSDIGRFEERAIGGLNESAATEGDDRRVTIVKGVEKLRESVGFHLAEGIFAEFAEDVGDGASGTGFDLAVEIDEAPSEALRENHADGSLTGTHETNEEYSAGAMVVAASDGLCLDRHLLHLRAGLSLWFHLARGEQATGSSYRKRCFVAALLSMTKRHKLSEIPYGLYYCFLTRIVPL